MKKRLSFISTVILGITALLVFGAGAVWLTETFVLPDWAFGLISSMGIVAYWEIVARFGPKQIDSPIGELFRLPIKDKVVLCIAFLGAFVVVKLGSEIGSRSGLVNFFFLIISLLTFRFICSSFGSQQLLGRVSKDQNIDEQG
jgi:hypothetical protein